MKKTYICISTISMATKLARVVAYVRKTPPTKLRDLLITKSRDKSRKLISVLPQGLWLPNLAEW